MEVASHGQCYSKVSLGNAFPGTTIHKRHALGKKRVLSKRRVVLHHAVRIHSQAGFRRGTVKIKEEEEELDTEESEQSIGTKKLFNLPVPSKLPGTVKLQNKSQSQPKTNKVIFVAGATGKVGSRTVRELLKLGFSVRASTRNVEKAQALFEDVGQISSKDAPGSDDGAPLGIFSPAKLFGFLRPKATGKRLEIVECDLESPESIETALGNAGVVVCCIGASEKEVLDVSGPYRIDFKATENLIKAASSADVSHFVLVTSLGTQKLGFPAAVLNLFWGVLVWKAKAEKALIQSGIPYTIVRPGGMERPTDAYKETHNLVLAEADKLFGGQVSNLQVAELLASIVENPDVSVNKIVEAIAETTAPLRPIRELLEEISTKEAASSPAPQSIRKAKPAKADVNAQKASKKQEEEKLAEERRVQAQREKEEKRIQAERDAETKRSQAERDAKEKLRLQELRNKYEEEIEAAREKEEAAKSAAAAAFAEKAELEKKAAEIRAKAEAAILAANEAKAVEAAVLAAARKGKVLSDEEKQKIVETVRLARQPKEAAPVEQPKPSLKKKSPFSFLGKTPPSTTATETASVTEPTKEEETEKVKVDTESKVKPKADKKAVAGKKQEEETLKKGEAKKLAEAKKKEDEERERAEKEAKERAEREAVEAKQKEAAEAKQKEEADAKKKEEEEKAKREAETKAKREEEELAEAKRKEVELAEAKKKEEEEKAIKEAEMLKAEAEENAKTLAKEEVAKQTDTVTATEDAKIPRRKGFRWFWEPAEPETMDVEESTEEDVKESTEEEVADVQEATKEKVAEVPVKAEVADQLPPCPTPLSPYARYPGLKPPSPPIASPPATKAESSPPPKAEKVASTIADAVSSEINSKDQIIEKVEIPPQKEPAFVTEEEPSKESEDDIEERKQRIQEIEARERKALEKAEAASPFKWFWQKPETSGEESASTMEEEGPATVEEAASLVPEEAAVSGSASSKEQTNSLPPSSRPLSPYAQFPNLKPPSPPKAFSAPQNGSVASSKLLETLPMSSTPLSPYAGFPDLKPPTSPGPLSENGVVPAAPEQEEEKAAEPTVSSGFKWPWQQ